MKRSLETMQASSNSSAKRSVTFSSVNLVHTIDCSDITTNLFYGKADYSRFQTDFMAEEKRSGTLTELRRRKRRQQDYQYETVAEIRRRKIENRILSMIQEGQRHQAAAARQLDICFQQRCIPLQRVPMRATQSQQSRMLDHAA